MIPCLFKWLTGIPCPACGTQRALILLIQGHVLDSLRMNPLGLFLFVLGVVVGSLWIYDRLFHKDTLHRLRHYRWPNSVIVLAAVLTLANWIWNIYKGV